MNPFEHWIMVFAVLMMHIILINPLEKMIMHNDNLINMRPVCLDKGVKTKSFECMGTPSGHMETWIILLFFLAMSWKVTNNVWVWLLMGSTIVMMALHRIHTRRHNLYQVAIGSLLGVCYGLVYMSIKLDRSIDFALFTTYVLMIISATKYWVLK
jgi:hypothetical protein